MSNTTSILKKFNSGEDQSFSKKEISEIKKELNSLQNAQLTYATIREQKLGKTIRLLADMCKNDECGEFTWAGRQVNYIHTKINNVLQNTFFDGDLSSDTQSEIDGQRIPSQGPQSCGSKQGSQLNGIDILRGSILNSNPNQRQTRERIMSESVNLNNYNRIQNYSIFDLLLNNRRNNMHLGTQQETRNQASDLLDSGIDPNQASSNLIETLLTEYLISLPSSLDEFYKIMGEIYVAEILRQCPNIRGPTELMKHTLLGSHHIPSNDQGYKNIIDSLVQHIMSLNLRQNRGMNPLESDLMRMLLTENAPPQPQSVPETPPPATQSPKSTLKIPRMFGESEESKNPKKSYSKIQRKTKENVLRKQESKQCEPQLNPPALNDVTMSSGDKGAHEILTHESLMERAKRLLKSRAASRRGKLLIKF